MKMTPLLVTRLAGGNSCKSLAALFGPRLHCSWAVCWRGDVRTNAIIVYGAQAGRCPDQFRSSLQCPTFRTTPHYTTCLQQSIDCSEEGIPRVGLTGEIYVTIHIRAPASCSRACGVFSAGTPYASSKAAMNQVTRNWGCEWAPDGIRVNAVAPWYTKTPLTEPVQADASRWVSLISGRNFAPHLLQDPKNQT